MKTSLTIVLLIVISFFSFYFGARFGPAIFWGVDMNQRRLLPADELDQEVEQLLQEEGIAQLRYPELLEEITTTTMAHPMVSTTTTTMALTIVIPPESMGVVQQIENFENEEQTTWQVGSFSDITFANNLQGKLKNQGLSSKIETETLKKGKWYRVYVGNYKNLKEAERDLPNIRKIIGSNPTLVTR